MFETDPLFREVSPSNLDAYREALRSAARNEATREAEIERELAELDAAIAGMDAPRMAALRDWASLSEPSEEERSRVIKKPR
jgi:hypothetical protein